jgi:hypothetical protein
MKNFVNCTSPKVLLNDQEKEVEIDRACSQQVKGRRHVRYWWKSQKEIDHWEDQNLGGWTILKWFLKR